MVHAYYKTRLYSLICFVAIASFYVSTKITKYSVTSWKACNVEHNVFLTIMKLSIQDCLLECIVRQECESVNFFLLRHQCDLLDSDVTMMTSHHVKPCMFIKKRDIIAELPVGCGACSMSEVCDISSEVCAIGECKALQFTNADVQGNVWRVGARAKIQPYPGYYLNGSETVVCHPDGSWRDDPHIFPVDCGDPPLAPFANISNGNTTYGHERNYTCLYGYDVNSTDANNVITCQEDGNWSAIQFHCAKSCGAPPTVEFATVSNGTTVKGHSRNYDCVYEYGLTNHSANTQVTCQDTGSWSAIEFECVEKTCETGWQKINQSCYKGLTFVPMWFSYAKTACSNRGAKLVYIETEEENNLLKEYLNAKYNQTKWWLAISDSESEGSWYNVYTGEIATYFDWGEGEPDNAFYGESCAIIGYDNTAWADVLCASYRYPLCEKSTAVWLVP